MTLQPPQLPAHTHGLAAAAQNGTTGTPSPAVALGTASAAVYGPPSDPVAMASEAIASAGGEQPHESRQPFLALHFVIALQGVFPPRS